MKVLCVDMLMTRLDILQANLSFRKKILSTRYWSLRHPPNESLKALSEFLISENVQVDKLSMALTGSYCSYHYFSVPYKKNKDIQANVPFEIEERVPFQPDDIHHTFQILARGKAQTEVLAAIIPKTLYNGFMEGIRQHNLEPEILTPGPIALAYSLLPISAKSPNAPIICIEIRDVHTYIVVTHGSSVIVCRTYPLGLHSFVVPTATFKDVSYDEAYDELNKIGPQFPPGDISDDLRDIIKPFFVEIKKTIMHVRSKGFPYISKIYLSGYGTEWNSFGELLTHEFQIPCDHNLLKETYSNAEVTPSLITNGLLSHFTSSNPRNLINFRVKELRAQQSIQELFKKFEAPERKALIKYAFGTICLIFIYFFIANALLSNQRKKLETKIKETVKKLNPELAKFQSTPTPSIITKSSEIQQALDKALKAQRIELKVLSGSGAKSKLDALKKLVDAVPRNFKSDLTQLSITETEIQASGLLVEGDLEQFKRRLQNAGSFRNIKQLSQTGNQFNLSTDYE